jgi:DNA polymerase-3 subunit delta'
MSATTTTTPGFSLLPWHQEAWSRVQQARAGGRLHHALLIVGMPGLGKLRLAEALARSLLCHQPGADGMPCGACRSCHLTAVGNHPDLHRVEPDPESKSGDIRVAAVREMTQAETLSAHSGGFKIVIIDPAERMNAHAANSLLKTLEEPTPSTLLFLVTARPGRLLATIRSRCQRLALTPPAEAGGLAWLREQGVTEDPLPALRQAGGAPLEALALLEPERLARRTGALDRFLELARGRGDPVALAAVWMHWDLPLLFGWMSGWVADVLRLASGLPEPRLDNPDRAGALRALAAGADRVALHRYWARLIDAREQVGHTNLSPQLVLEQLLADWFELAGRR